MKETTYLLMLEWSRGFFGKHYIATIILRFWKLFILVHRVVLRLAKHTNASSSYKLYSYWY